MAVSNASFDFKSWLNNLHACLVNMNHVKFVSMVKVLKPGGLRNFAESRTPMKEAGNWSYSLVCTCTMFYLYLYNVVYVCNEQQNKAPICYYTDYNRHMHNLDYDMTGKHV